MRLFAAVVPPTSARAELAAVLAGVELPAVVRAVPDRQRHLTVAFYGEVPDPAVADLGERLRRAAARTSPLSLRLKGFGTFPANAGRARVLWAGVAGDTAELARLADRAVAAGRRAGLDVDDRAYRAHLTIGRARGESADLRAVVASAVGFDGTPWTATELVLVKSTLGAEVRHEPIAQLPFAIDAG
jgi:2'-5' RNA ligase